MRQPDARALRDIVVLGYDRLADAYAREFWQELERKPADRALLAEFARTIPADAPVVDLGCGPAQIGRFLADAGRAVIGVDLSAGMCREARSRNPDIAFTCQTMLELGLGNMSLGGIVAFYSLIHLLRDDIPRALAECHRCLRPGGSLLVAMHGGEGDVSVDEMLGEPVPMYATLVTLDELCGALEAAGFAIDMRLERKPYDFEYPTQRLYVRARR